MRRVSRVKIMYLALQKHPISMHEKLMAWTQGFTEAKIIVEQENQQEMFKRERKA